MDGGGIDGVRLDDLGTSASSDKGTGSDGVTDVGHLDGTLQSFDAADRSRLYSGYERRIVTQIRCGGIDSAAALDAQLNDGKPDAQLIDVAAMMQSIDAQTIGDAEAMDAAGRRPFI